MLTILASFGCAGQYRRMAALSVVFRLTVCGRKSPVGARCGPTGDFRPEAVVRCRQSPTTATRIGAAVCLSWVDLSLDEPVEIRCVKS